MKSQPSIRSIVQASFLTLLLTGLVSCSSARYVLKEPETGIIAMPADTPRNREKATELMAQHFPNGYIIDREQETVIGQVTHHQTHHQTEHQTEHGTTTETNKNQSVESGQSNAIATTVDKTEYRIFYRRR